MQTAGELLAKMLTKEKNGEDTAEIRKEFEYQSKRQLGGYCSDFSMGIKRKEGEDMPEIDDYHAEQNRKKIKIVRRIDNG